MPLNPVGIVIHTADTPEGWSDGKSIEDIKQDFTNWHTWPKPKGRGWRALGYNWIIHLTGEEVGGRDLDDDGDYWEEVGAHVRGWNRKAIGICLVPRKNGGPADGRIEDFYTPEQIAALENRIHMLLEKFPSIEWVKGHNQFANKTCPFFNAERWWKGLPAKRALLESTTMRSGSVSALSVAGAGATAVGALDGTAQIIAVVLLGVALLGIGWMMREYIKNRLKALK